MTSFDNVEIRPAAQADLGLLIEQEPRHDSQLPKQHLADQAQGAYIFATAWAGNKPIGWCTLDHRESELQPELAHLWVVPEARRQGIGRALTTWLENQARQLGFTEVFLLVDPDNERAIPLYLDLDYSPTGEHQQNIDDVSGVKSHMAIYRKSLALS